MELDRTVANVLAIRAGERLQYGWPPLPPSRRGYYVALTVVPALPGPPAPTVTQYGVVCAAQYEDGWRWIQLEPSTKDMIGGDLLEMDAVPGEWHCLVLLEWWEEPVPVAEPMEAAEFESMRRGGFPPPEAS